VRNESSSAATESASKDHRLALALLKQRYGKLVHGAIRAALPRASRRASDDLCQQAFEETLNRQFDGRSRFEDWIMEIAVELVRNYTQSAELDERTLVAAQSGAPWARNLLGLKYCDRIYRLIWQVLPSACKHAAEDLCHDTFAKAMQELGAFEFEGSARLSTWISTIAVNLAINEARRQRTWAPAEAIEELPAPGCPEEHTSNRQQCDRVAKAMDALSDDERALLSLAAAHVPHSEIAEIMGFRTVEAARTRFRRARAALRERVS
jgi:RNA polymerase sigma factor (sigma-70 family)